MRRKSCNTEKWHLLRLRWIPYTVPAVSHQQADDYWQASVCCLLGHLNQCCSPCLLHTCGDLLQTSSPEATDRREVKHMAKHVKHPHADYWHTGHTLPARVTFKRLFLVKAYSLKRDFTNKLKLCLYLVICLSFQTYYIWPPKKLNLIFWSITLLFSIQFMF